LTEKEFVEGLHDILPSHDDETTRKWLDSFWDRTEQHYYALNAFSFVACNFNKHILEAVYRMEPIAVLRIPEAALRLNAGASSEEVGNAAKSGWDFRLGFVPSSPITYRPLGLYTLVASGREIHYYSTYCHIHGLDNPFVGLDEYARNIGKSLSDAFYAVQGNPALADWFCDELPADTIIFKRTFEREAKLLLANLHNSTAIGPVYRQDYDYPEKSYILIDHIK